MASGMRRSAVVAAPFARTSRIRPLCTRSQSPGARPSLEPVAAALAFGATVIATLFTLATSKRYTETRAAHQLAWTIALAMFTAASAAGALGCSTGWDPGTYRVFYCFGAILDVVWLALGTVLLLAPASAAAPRGVSWRSPGWRWASCSRFRSNPYPSRRSRWARTSSRCCRGAGGPGQRRRRGSGVRGAVRLGPALRPRRPIGWRRFARAAVTC